MASSTEMLSFSVPEKVTGLLRMHSAFSLVLVCGTKSSPSNRAVLGRKGQFGGSALNTQEGWAWGTPEDSRTPVGHLGKSEHK